MSRLLLFLCCICASWMARGQAAYDWLYWFDMNHASHMSGQSIGDRFTITADADGLSEGIHTFHVQVADTAGKYSPPLGQLFYYTNGQSVKRLYYWFDNEVALTQTVPAPLNDLSIDVSGLKPGLHFIYCQVEDAAGTFSDVVYRAFYRQAIQSDMTWTYWFDEDEDSRVTVPFPGEVTMIDVSHLQEGFHVLHNQVIDVTASDITTTMFIKVPQTEGAGEMTCICIVDGKMVAKETLPTAGGILKWNMDVDNLDLGIHKAMFQVITPSGVASSIAERYFIRTITNKEMSGMKCLYTIDNFQTKHQTGTLSDGLFHFDLDVASIENGLHRLAYTLVSENGVTLPQQTAFFWKTPLGGEGIVQYDYWINENDDQKHVVHLDQHANPFSLIALLPVEAQPIRSSSFQFAIKNGEPLIYARNDFHIQFFDTNGHMVEETKDYYDEQVSTTVETVGELQATQTFDRLVDNDIRWYTMQAAPGDTVAFKLSQPATIQLFAPSGAEVFKTSESASVKWGGIHTWEDGTYYLAVHNVTGSKDEMTLDYMHMDKYDVVDWDVHTVGNGGFSTITFNGNGFYHLYSIELLNSQGDTIKSHEIEYLSDSQIRAWFNFFEVETGVYDAIFDFGDERKAVDNTITVENAKDIDLATDVRYSNTYLRGRETAYTYEITNNGNMTAYGIPVYLYIVTVTRDGIKKINIEEIDKPDYTDIPGLTDEERQEIINMRQASGDDMYFYISESHDGQGNSETVRSNYFHVEIPPYSSKTVTVTLEATEPVTTYLNVSDGSLPLMTTANMRTLSSHNERQRTLRDQYCCIRDRLECGLNVLSDVSGLIGHFVPEGTPVSAITSAVSCTSSILSNLSQNVGYYLCRDYDGNDNLDVSVDSYNRFRFGANLASSVIGCIAPDFRNPAQQIIEDARNLINDTRECVQTFNNSKEGCLPNRPKGGTSTPINSCEPNDILGYVAESGSKAIKEGHTDVFYTIQFENDTVFATAPAHDIYLTDTLDVKLFDFSTYRPTRITVGKKSMELTGERNFISTMDMRPEINAIAQIEGTINDKTGIVRWHISSLDPMTMEPSDDPMVGVLPVNFDGSGMGEATFTISLKPGLPDGTIISNRSGNVFDYNETVLTPTWTNIVDAVAPTSTITDVTMENDTIARLHIVGEDNLSGIWYYDVYAQYGKGTMWVKVGDKVTDSQFDFRVYEDIDYGYCVLAVDSAGNVEQKAIDREWPKTPDIPTDVNDVPISSSSADSEPIYDLQGRPALPIQKGVYIQRGKKRLRK